MNEVHRLTGPASAKLALYPSTFLHHPFAESVDEIDRAYLDFARRRGVPLNPLARELVNEDYRRLRLDPCCHFNADRHRVLARVFERSCSSYSMGNTGRSSRARSVTSAERGEHLARERVQITERRDATPSAGNQLRA